MKYLKKFESFEHSDNLETKENTNCTYCDKSAPKSNSLCDDHWTIYNKYMDELDGHPNDRYYQEMKKVNKS